MPRTRSIKPGFFTNDQLAEIEPLGRLLFAGLWTQADRDGRLLDRPRKLKAELLPYDDCDANVLLDQLASRGFIVRYVVDGVALIQVVTWSKHQQPHINEKPSELPAPVLSTDGHRPSITEAPEQNGTSTVRKPEQHGANTPRSWSLVSGPCSLEPRPGEPEEDDAPAAPAAAALPEAVLRLNELLTGQPGWAPSPDFLRKVATKYPQLDLEAEAFKILSWLVSKQNRKKQDCSTRFVLNWCETATKDRPPNGQSPPRKRYSSIGNQSGAWAQQPDDPPLNPGFETEFYDSQGRRKGTPDAAHP